MKRHPKTQKQSPTLLILIIASIFFISIASSVSAHGIYQEYDTEGISQPAAAVLMQGLSHHVYPWDAWGKDSGSSQLASLSARLSAGTAGIASGSPGSSGLAGGSGTAGTPSGSTPDSGTSAPPDIHETADSSDAKDATPPDGQPADPSAKDGLPGGQPADPSAKDGLPGGQPADPSSQDGLPGGQPPASSVQEPMQYEFTQVAQDYFDDALVIGDSRAVGIKLYSGWDNITYYAESGMTVYNMFTRSISLKDGTETTIEEALKENTFGKIYLEIGINEMGTGTVDSFMEAYEGAVQHLREMQPEADLFLCGIMYVRQSRSESDPIFNNPGIRERNERIAALADQNSIFYLDINEVTSDATGNLNPDYTWDEVHLLGRYNVLWTEFLSSHGIIKTPSEANAPQ